MGDSAVAVTLDRLILWLMLLALAGAQTVAIPSIVAMRRRGMGGVARVLARMPAYFGLVWAATWVALFELAARPHHWGKTDHGRRRTDPPARRFRPEKAG